MLYGNTALTLVLLFESMRTQAIQIGIAKNCWRRSDRTKADSVVVSMNAEGSACLQRAAAAAQNSLLGNGGSSHRIRSDGRWVDHGHHALMTTAAFKAVGGYDEAFSHNEDAELDVRLTKADFASILQVTCR